MSRPRHSLAELGAKAARPESRAEDERTLLALQRRDDGEPLKHIAARMGFLSGAVLGSIFADVDRETDASEGRPTRAVPRRVSPAGARICAVPDCGRALYPRNRSGVCRGHNHAVGFCGCVECAR